MHVQIFNQASQNYKHYWALAMHFAEAEKQAIWGVGKNVPTLDLCVLSAKPVINYIFLLGRGVASLNPPNQTNKRGHLQKELIV